MPDRYECTLSGELFKKAQAELNEPTDNDERLKAIDALRTRFQEESGLDLVRSDDAFILRFLRVKKFEQDRAYNCLVNYHKHREEWPEVFSKVNCPSLLSNLLNYGPILPLGQVARDKTYVLVGRPGLGFDETNDMTCFIAILVLTLEKLLEEESFQIHGVTIIEDMSYFGVTLAMQMPLVGRRFLNLVQDSMPVRVKSLNMIHEAKIFDMIYAVVSKFMKEKMKKRLQLHGSEYSRLHEMIPKDKLPKSFDGTGPDLDPDVWKQVIMSHHGEGEDTAL